MTEGFVKFKEMSHEIRPPAALYPPPPSYKKCALKGCGGGRLMPTAFAPQLKKIEQKGIDQDFGYSLSFSFIRREGEKEVVRKIKSITLCYGIAFY